MRERTPPFREMLQAVKNEDEVSKLKRTCTRTPTFLYLRIGQSTVVKDLQQKVPYFAMRLFKLIQQQDLIWLPANGLGQDSPFLKRVERERGMEGGEKGEQKSKYVTIII